MTRSAIIHIGAHKTGTSAIQVALRTRQSELQKQNWEILLPPTPKGIPANWNHMFQMVGQNYTIKEQVLSRMVKAIEGSDRNIILSSEELFFLDQGDIEKFCNIIRPFFSKIVLVAYLRRQDRMMIAHWEQGAKTEQSANLFLSTDHPFKCLTPNAYRYLDYADRLSLWKTHLKPSQTVIRNYVLADLHQKDSVSDFLKTTGLNLSYKRRKKNLNRGLSSESVRFIYELRRSGYTRKNLNSLLKSKALPSGTLRASVGRGDVEAFLEKFAGSNRNLAIMADQPGSLRGGAFIRKLFPLTTPQNFFRTDDIASLPNNSEFPEYSIEQKYKALVEFHAQVKPG